jgi:putative oxygen-independent coproporphyrinogen III oxidase
LLAHADLVPPTAAYIHIPFCRRRCYYCDFPVFVVGDRRSGENSGTISLYLEQLLQEIDGEINGSKPLMTIFFGGGTPSLLTPAQIGQILDRLSRKFGIHDRAEISLEADPGTFNLERINGYLQAGINRCSMGVQAFQDRLLALAGRSHTVADIEAAAGILERAGVENWSLDLISGLPQQQLTDWEASLHHAMALSPPHISCYDLIVEPQTPFAKQYQPGIKPLPGDETTAEMYRMARERLGDRGYIHYEISNYGQSGYECRHNLTYWQNLPYYGFGMGAASHLEGYRFTRPRQTQAYYQWLATGANWREVKTTKIDRLLETLMLGLRLREGIDPDRIDREYGTIYREKLDRAIERYRRMGWLEIGDLGRLRLSDPEGMLFSNEVLATIFKEIDGIPAQSTKSTFDPDLSTEK